jgi:hypothetical protein
MNELNFRRRVNHSNSFLFRGFAWNSNDNDGEIIGSLRS